MKVKLHPAFVVYIIFLIVYGQSISIFFYLLSVAIHEFAHGKVAKILGYKLDKMTIMPYGVCLNYETTMFSPYDEILIALFGPLANFIVCVILLALWWLFPLIYPQTVMFFWCNLILFAYNLLPCFPLDGGRILCAYLSTKHKKDFSLKVTLLFNKLICVVFVLTFVVGIFWGVYNFNLLIISFFMFISILEPKKLSSYNYISFKTFSFKKKKSIKFILVKSDDFLYKVVSKMNKFKFNIFYILYPNSKTKVITENSLNNFCLVYEPTVRLCEIKELV